MKTIMMTIVAIMATTIIATAQQNTVNVSKYPQIVTDAFASKYPTIQVDKWKKKKETYIARFFTNGKKYFATFSTEGKWVQTQTIIKWKELPKKVAATHELNDNDIIKSISTIRELETPDYDKIYIVVAECYDVSQEENSTYRYNITSDGKVLKKERLFYVAL
jgi:hypothetical protein